MLTGFSRLLQQHLESSVKIWTCLVALEGRGVKPGFLCKELNGACVNVWMWELTVRCRIMHCDPFQPGAPPVPRDLSSTLRVQAHWASWTWEMQQNFCVKKDWSLSISFPSFRSCFSQSSPGMSGFFSLPRKVHQAETANPSLGAREYPHNVPSLQIYEMMLVGFKPTFM